MSYFQLIGEGAYALPSALHGAFAFLLAIAIAVSFETLLNLNSNSLKRLRISTIAISVISFITIFYGNIVYIGYRSSGGVREYLLQNLPAAHKYGMEFKEFIALFSLPLVVVAAYIVWTMGEDLIKNKWMRYTVMTCIGLAFLYTAGAFGLAAAITKIKAV